MTAPLEVEGVRKAFGVVVVAHDLSFSLGRGETLGIVGPNGAGKTSLLNLITGSLAQDSGRILIEGTDVSRLAAHDRARLGVARTYQIPRPFSGLTVFENVLLAASFAGKGRGAGREAIDVSVSALERTELLSRANQVSEALPLLDRKRLELARALAAQPTLLLLDEIAGGLTEAEVDALVETIRSLKAEGLSIVWVEHIVEALVAAVDRLMAMDVGRKLAVGAPRDVLAMPEVQAVYLGQDATA